MTMSSTKDILLKCHLCSLRTLSKQTLSVHARKEHQAEMSPKDVVNRYHCLKDTVCLFMRSISVVFRSLDNVGLISCRVCFVLMEREYASLTQHYFRVHKISYTDLVAKYGLEQTESDLAATRDMASLTCPACGDETKYAGPRVLRDHYEAVHGWNIVWIGKLLKEVAATSNVVAPCGRCVNIVARDRLEEHWKLCGSSIFTSNNNYSRRFSLNQDKKGQMTKYPKMGITRRRGRPRKTMPGYDPSTKAVRSENNNFEDSCHKIINDPNVEERTILVLPIAENEETMDEHESIVAIISDDEDSTEERATMDERESFITISSDEDGTEERLDDEIENDKISVEIKDDEGDSDSPAKVDESSGSVAAYSDLLESRYTCPECKEEDFPSLNDVTSHIGKMHNGDVSILDSVKAFRKEVMTFCEICDLELVSDEVELGSHVWIVHDLPLRAYLDTYVGVPNN